MENDGLLNLLASATHAVYLCAKIASGQAQAVDLAEPLARLAADGAFFISRNGLDADAIAAQGDLFAQELMVHEPAPVAVDPYSAESLKERARQLEWTLLPHPGKENGAFLFYNEGVTHQDPRTGRLTASSYQAVADALHLFFVSDAAREAHLAMAYRVA